MAAQPPEARPTISTHVLDTERGVPAAGVHVTLYRTDVGTAPIRVASVCQICRMSRQGLPTSTTSGLLPSRQTYSRGNGSTAPAPVNDPVGYDSTRFILGR